MPSKAVKLSTKTTVKASSAKRMTVASLAKNLDLLETRLKKADTKNKTAVKALEKVVADIKATAKQSKTTQKAALTRGLNQLEIRMETYLERTVANARANVRSELANVTAPGADLSTLENALAAAHTRLDEADTAQRDSLARMNRHIASLATSVDKRLTQESESRQAENAALETKIDTVRKHVDSVETEMANALEAVGEKVAEFASVLNARSKTSDADTAERLADLAKETQSDFNHIQEDVTTRLEALEIIASAWSPTAPSQHSYEAANEDDPRFDQMSEMIQKLQNEISELNSKRDTPQAPLAAVQMPLGSSPNVIPMPVAELDVPQNPYTEAVQAIGHANGEAALLTPNMQPEPAPIPAAIPSPKKVKSATQGSHIPQEFDPAAFVPYNPTGLNSAATNPVIGAIPPPLAQPPVLPAVPPLAPPAAAATSPLELPHQPQINAQLPTYELMQAPLPVSTYADPAYAEAEDMRAERIGGIGSKRPTLPKLAIPKLPISGQNLRVGVLATGVAVFGLIAAKSILGGPESSNLETPPLDAYNTAQQLNADSSLQNSDFTQNSGFTQTSAAKPQPDSFDLFSAPETSPVVEAPAGTLDAAVAAGDPIAQFQKGLALLQAGQLQEGARHIRLSANRNQPAAQYRLAKLYETGTGLAVDKVTARELIQRAARGGNRIAMHDLGNYYALGDGGLTPDMNAAIDWFTKAAERGVVDSQFNVAYLREGNQGIAADLDTSLFWYHVAARQGDRIAPARIAILNEQMSPTVQAEIKARADQFNPKPVDEAANGVFRNVAWSVPADKIGRPSQAQVQAQDKAQSAEVIRIRDAQTLLTDLGYQIGAPDGIAGTKTREAIKAFEGINNMPETGEVSDELIKRLEIATGA